MARDPSPRAGREGAARAKAARIAAAIRGNIEPVQVSGLYRLGLVLVAVAMVLLPLIYLGLIGLVGYGVYLHATGGIGAAGEASRSLFLYLAPLAVGVILIVFMVKPLFAASAAARARCPVYPTREPVLWAFVEQICRAVRAPVPARIHVDCDVNASASFRRGLLSFRGDDLALTIGLPLVAGLELDQLGGVLAHELGHFTQGAGMRLTYLIRGIHLWFARVVEQRDVLDRQLERRSRSGDHRLRIILLAARLCIWITRRILWLLMLVGHAISSFMLRQMEFHADRYEARLAGADRFASTALRLRMLDAAAQSAASSLHSAWEEERLVDDLPRLIVSRLARMPGEVRTAIERHVRTAPTGLLDTHPSDRDRIASVRRRNAPAIFSLAAPATGVFQDFDRLSRAATRSHYRQVLGPGTERLELVPFADLEETHAALEAGSRALDHFFRGVLLETRGLRLSTELERRSSSPRATVEKLGRARREMEESQSEARRLVHRRNKLLEKAARARAAATLLEAGLSVRGSDYGLPGSDLRAATRAAGEAHTESFRLEEELEPYFRAAEERMASALALLPHPELASRIADHARLVEEAPRLVESLPALSSALQETEELRSDSLGLTTLSQHFNDNEENEEFLTSLRGLTGRAVRRLGKLGAQLEPLAYPFDGQAGRISTGRYVLGGDVLDESDVGCVDQAVQRSLERLDGLYLRVLGRLADIAGRVEAVVVTHPDKQPTGA